MKEFPYKHISVLIMPTDFCNMNCVYCFNTRKTHEKKKVMSLETVRKIFEITIPYYEEVKFIWHGGEPTSMGKQFYRTVIEMQREINVNNAKIENSIQSNLTLLDEDFVKFLLENNIRVGGSFDGTMNHLTRHNTDKILKGRQLIIEQGGSVGFICVVQSKNIDHLIEDYEWFKEKGINYTLNQYMATPPYENDELYVPTEHYIERICEFFDYWAKDTKCNIRISYFNDFIDYILFGKKSLCCYNSCLGKHVGIQYNGDIYNCNRDFSKEYCYGNVYDYQDIHDCFKSDGFENMVKQAVKRRECCKKECEIFDFCAGGCNSSAYMSGDISKGNEAVCQVTKAVYRYIEKKIADLLEKSDQEWKEQLNPILSKKFIEIKKGVG